MKFISDENDKGVIIQVEECLPHVVVPDCARVIGDCTFEGETILESIELPHGLETIGVNAFALCANLTSVAIPNTVTTIEDGAFESCLSLKEIVLPPRLSELGTLAFFSCAALERVVIPEGIKTIRNETFHLCEQLKEVILPDELSCIEFDAFTGCKSLKEITIPESVTDIDPEAFSGDRGLIICGKAGSYAERYAKERHIKFRSTEEKRIARYAASESPLCRNPFYILDIPCTADRKRIVSAAEEQGFFGDSKVFDNARDALLNPAKRLSAEFDWFADVEADTIQQIRECIQNCAPIFTDKLSPLSKLNAEIHNFAIAEEEDLYEIGYGILNLDSLYASIDLDDLYNAFCRMHAQNKLPEISRNDFEQEFNAKRNMIRQVINSKISALIWNDYIELATIIAEKCIANTEYDDGVVLSDILDSYEIEIADEVAEEAEDFMNTEGAFASSQKYGGVKDVKARIESLVQKITNWDKKVQPLQLRSMVSGMPHALSEKVGRSMRSLALYLNNELNDTENALYLVRAMESIFAEIKSLSNIFAEDSEELDRILTSHKEIDVISTDIKDIEKAIDDAKAWPSKEKIDAVLAKTRVLNQKINSSKLDDDGTLNVRVKLCITVRSFAISLHNEKRETAMALDVANALNRIFGDISDLQPKLLEDVQALQRQLNIKKEQEEEKKAKFIITIVIIALIACISFFSSLGSDSKSSSSTAKTEYPKVQETEVRFSSSATTGAKVYADINSIFPEIGIYTEGQSYYRSFVCRATTTSGTTVWIHMSVSEYKENFDADAATSIHGMYAEKITLATAQRIHGKAKRADSVLSGLSKDIGSQMLIDFVS